MSDMGKQTISATRGRYTAGNISTPVMPNGMTSVQRFEQRHDIEKVFT